MFVDTGLMICTICSRFVDTDLVNCAICDSFIDTDLIICTICDSFEQFCVGKVSGVAASIFSLYFTENNSVMTFLVINHVMSKLFPERNCCLVNNYNDTKLLPVRIKSVLQQGNKRHYFDLYYIFRKGRTELME